MGLSTRGGTVSAVDLIGMSTNICSVPSSIALSTRVSGRIPCRTLESTPVCRENGIQGPKALVVWVTFIVVCVAALLHQIICPVPIEPGVFWRPGLHRAMLPDFQGVVSGFIQLVRFSIKIIQLCRLQPFMGNLHS